MKQDRKVIPIRKEEAIRFIRFPLDKYVDAHNLIGRLEVGGHMAIYLNGEPIDVDMHVGCETETFSLPVKWLEGKELVNSHGYISKWYVFQNPYGYTYKCDADYMKFYCEAGLRF